MASFGHIVGNNNGVRLHDKLANAEQETSTLYPQDYLFNIYEVKPR